MRCIALSSGETWSKLNATATTADSPELKALLNAASGATVASFEQIVAAGTGSLLYSGQIAVVDGAREIVERMNRALTNKHLLGAGRQADTD